jgi:hypothetical protein
MLIGVVAHMALEFTIGTNSSAALIVSAVLILIGVLTFKYAILKACKYTPLVPA